MESIIFIKMISVKEVKKIIHNRSFREADFTSSQDKMKELIRGVIHMQINELIFKVMRILIKFFRFPILPLFKPIYDRIQRDKEKYLAQSQPDLAKIAAYAKAIIKERSFPSLEFYFKAGCDSTLPQELIKNEHDSKFINFIGQIDHKINKLSSYSFQLSDQRKKLQQIEVMIQFKIKDTKLIIQKMCLQSFQKKLKDRKEEIQKQLQLQQQSNNYKPQRTKRTTITIYTKHGQKYIQDAFAAGEYLCCRSYFYLDEIIQEPQTLIQEYKNYRYPYQGNLVQILTKTICGFLNGKGGIIYIGIYQGNKTKIRIVEGQKYPQTIKQKLLTYFRMLCQKISPDIVNSQLYKIEFVPLKDPFKNGWIPGKFIVRLKVPRGNKNDLYSYRRDDGEEMFAFRTENQVLQKRIGQEILELFRKRLMSEEDTEKYYLNHPGPCRAPDMGKQIFQYDNPNKTIPLPWDDKKKHVQYKQRNENGGKSNYIRDLQPFKRGFLLWNSKSPLLADLLQRGKQLQNGWAILQPENSDQLNSIQEILLNRKLLDKVRVISQLIRITDSNRNDISLAIRQLQGNKVFFVDIDNNWLKFKDASETVNGIAILDKLNLNYTFQINNKY